jgi:hypothetical protein
MTDAERHSLKQSLARLQAELARAPRLDDNAKRRLRAALADIERRMHDSSAPPLDASAPSATPHPLESFAIGFESDHPTLAASLRQFIELLGQAGL